MKTTKTIVLIFTSLISLNAFGQITIPEVSGCWEFSSDKNKVNRLLNKKGFNQFVISNSVKIAPDSVKLSLSYPESQPGEFFIYAAYKPEVGMIIETQPNFSLKEGHKIVFEASDVDAMDQSDRLKGSYFIGENEYDLSAYGRRKCTNHRPIIHNCKNPSSCEIHPDCIFQ